VIPKIRKCAKSAFSSGISFSVIQVETGNRIFICRVAINNQAGFTFNTKVNRPGADADQQTGLAWQREARHYNNIRFEKYNILSSLAHGFIFLITISI